jgi:hypothetical protein
MSSRTRHLRLLALFTGLAWPACAAAPKPIPKTVVIAPAPAPAPALEKQRQTLRISPLEMVFSGVRGQPGDDQGVSVKNLTADGLQVRTIRIVGEHAATFTLTDLPTLPRYIAPDKSIDFRVAFAPTAEATVGVHRATLQIVLGPNDELGPLVDISALVTVGKAGEQEPPLQEVVHALGYLIDVGGPQLLLGTESVQKGEEIVAPLFRSIKPGNIALDPVARFSPDGAMPYGYYRADPTGKPTEKQLGILAATESQRLNPGFEDGEGSISFDPGPEPFGLYIRLPTHTTYTEDTRNPVRPATKAKRRKKDAAPPFDGTVSHATRVFPLKSRNGTPIENVYLVAFEDAVNGDYQDAVFVLWNVLPVSAP